MTAGYTPPMERPRTPDAPAADNRISDLAAWLEQRGVPSGRLRALREELDTLERPPGLLRAWSRSASDFATRQWGHLVGELRESSALMDIVRRGCAGEELSLAERTQARAQLLDLLRMAPAGMLVLVLQAVPVPGTGLLAPWMLRRLGLMPSRWREAHLLHALQEEAERLRAGRYDAEASAVDALREALTAEARQRDAQAAQCALLDWWDADGNGEWDPPERAAYAEAVARLALGLPDTRHQRRWYVAWNHQVFGPIALVDLVDDAPGGPLLVRLEGDPGWVRLSDLGPRARAGQEARSSADPS